MELKERDFQGVKINFKTMNENRNSYKSKFSSALTSFSKVIFPSCFLVTSFPRATLVLQHVSTIFRAIVNCLGRRIAQKLKLIFNLNEKWSIIDVLSRLLKTYRSIHYSNEYLFNTVVALTLPLAINFLWLLRVIANFSNISSR